MTALTRPPVDARPRAIETLRSLSTWGRLSADQRQAILAGLAALREAPAPRKIRSDADLQYCIWWDLGNAMDAEERNNLAAMLAHLVLSFDGDLIAYLVKRHGATPPANAPETEKTT